MRALRKSRGLSQQALGFAADVDRTYVGSIERGEQNVTFETLWQLLHAMGVTWAEFGQALAGQPALTRRPIGRRERPTRHKRFE